MVQGKLLTMHHGGDHGDGEASGGQSSLRYGARQVLQAIPRSESRRRRNSRVFRVVELSLGIFLTRGKNRPKGDLGGAPWPRRPEGAATPWPRQAGTWPGAGPPRGPLRASGVFRHGYIFGTFWNFLSTFIFHLLSAMHRQKHTETSTGH